MKQKSKKAFTLVELLVVIAIIAILATLAIVALQQARKSARDAKRIADIRQMQTALELYFNDWGQYPDALGTSIASGTYVYMNQVPTSPTPADGDCGASNTYAYSTTESGGYISSYTISFCLGSQVGSFSSGSKYATPVGIFSDGISGGGNGGSLSCLNSNYGFESIDSNFQLDGWRLFSMDGSFNQSFSYKPIKTTDSNSGSSALRFQGSDPYMSILESRNEVFLLENGQDYDLSFYAKGDSTMLIVIIRDENGNCWTGSSWQGCVYSPGVDFHMVSISSDNWSSYSLDNITGAGDNIGLLIIGTSNTTLIDDIDLSLSSGGSNLFANYNPSFENWLDSPQGWIFNVLIDDVGVIDTTPANVYSGSRSVKLSNPEGNFPAVYTRSPITVANSFNISFRYKTENINGFNLTLESGNFKYDFDTQEWLEDDRAKSILSSPLFNLSESVSIPTPPNGSFVPYISIPNTETGSLWIDDFCISY